MAWLNVSISSARTARMLCAAAVLAAAPLAAHAEPQRIVSIGGAVTEVLYRLGVQDRIVAVDQTSLYPSDALSTKKDIGYIRALSAEGVLSVSPDLIIMEADAGPPNTVALLDQAKIPVVHVPSGHSLEELPRKIREVAAAVGKSREGDRIAGKVEGELVSLRNDLSAITKRKRVLFILSLVDGRPMAAGTHTAADAIIALAGAENVFASVKGYKTISPEAAAALQPDVILMITRSSMPTEGENLLDQPAFAETPAGRTGGFIKMDGLYLLGFGPRTGEAARDLAARLYPDLGLSGTK